MDTRLTRRTLSVGAAAVVTGASGCLSFGNDPPVPGSLRLRNETETEVTVSVQATKVSEDSDDPQQYNETPAPDAESTVVRDDRFELPAEDDHLLEGWLSTPGLYFLEANVGSERVDTEWIGLYPAGPNGTSVAEETVHLTVEETRVRFGLSVSD
ncbi:hypothetical protein [Halohasta salina]|uniref:hypothetical protein n=1 Tax=Halohasta salina TaxID=2961621 RepID=UPI0020A59525|nr:hypothetical protein [Halohasta salina]